ncbi:MAG: GNAT family N-acetyltransferase [Acidobacteria bacterium]|nr:GNAT family N-acetyltransferase [Acidobacteriota bacterium]
MEKKNFDFKLVDYDNLNELTEMFNLCFNLMPSENYFEWKFLHNPAGKAIGFVAYHEGEVAGFYGVIPEQFMVNGEKTLVYQSMDTMTHPKYQRQGLLTSLAKKTYEHLIEQDGEVFIIGFPGETSHPILVKKLGWKDIVLIDIIFLNQAAFKMKSLFRKTSNLSFEKIEKFDESFKSYFENKNYPVGRILRRYDENFLNWRVLSNPLFEYEVVKMSEAGDLVGFLVYALYEKKRCFIYHIDFAEDELYEKYLNSVCNYLFEENQSNFLYTFEPTQPLLAELFKKNWFIKNIFGKGPFSYKPPLTGFSNCEKIKNVDFFQKESYHIQPLLRDY